MNKLFNKFSLILLSIVLVSCEPKPTDVDPWPELKELTVNLDSIPTIYSEIKASEITGAFAAFIVPDSIGNTSVALNIQFSYEDAEVGLDWVLIGKSNIRDRGVIEDYLKVRAVPFVEKYENDVRYLRVTDGDLVLLCQGILKDIYKVRRDETFGVVYDKVNLEKYISK